MRKLVLIIYIYHNLFYITFIIDNHKYNIISITIYIFQIITIYRFFL